MYGVLRRRSLLTSSSSTRSRPVVKLLSDERALAMLMRSLTPSVQQLPSKAKM
jgi:hypothetical protein